MTSERVAVTRRIAASADELFAIDWTAIPDDAKVRVQWPIVPVTMLEQSVEKLERVATTR